MRPYPLFLLRLLASGVAAVSLADAADTLAFAERPGGSTILLERSKDCFGDPLPRYAWGRLGTIRWRHGSYVFSVAFHPSGKTLASTSEDGSVRIWDVATGKQLRRLEGHRGTVLSIAFDHKGERLAGVAVSISERATRGQLLLWDYRTGDRIWAQQTEEDPTSVAFSPDGTALATGGYLDNAYLWDTKTGKMRAQFPYDKPKDECKRPHPRGVVSFSRDGRLLACGGDNGKGHIWNVASGEKVWGLDSEDSPQGIVISPDCKMLASRASKDELALWDVASRKQLGTIPVPFTTVFQFSPNGKLLAVGEEGYVISFWDVSTRKKIRTAKWTYPGGLSGFDRVSIIAFSPDGKHLAWGGLLDHRVHLLDVAKGEECQVSREPNGPIGSIAFSPDGQILALGGHYDGFFDQTFCLWSPASLKVLKTYDAKGPIWSLTLSPDGRSLAVGAYGLHLWDLAAGKSTRLDKDEDSLGFINTLVFTPDGSQLIFGDQTPTVRIWDARTGRESRRFRGSAGIYALALSPNGRLLAAGDEMSSVYVWNLTRNKEVAHFAAQQGWIRAAAFSPDGTTLASGGEGRTIRAWEMTSGKTCLQLNCDDTVNCLAFSRDGHFLASSGKDGAVSLWELATGKRVARLTGHQGAVRAIAFSPDGKTLATASDDTTGLLWHWQEALPPRDKQSSPLASRDLQRYWKDLANQDARMAYQAIWTLAASPDQGVSLIREHLHPIAAPDAQRIARLIADLDSDNLAERNKASRELTTLGELAEPHLRKAIENKASPELCRRAKELLDRLDRPLTSPAKLRNLRALVVLEQSKTPESIALLNRLASGAPGARLTQEAQAILSRLEKEKSGGRDSKK